MVHFPDENIPSTTLLFNNITKVRSHSAGLFGRHFEPIPFGVLMTFFLKVHIEFQGRSRSFRAV